MLVKVLWQEWNVTKSPKNPYQFLSSCFPGNFISPHAFECLKLTRHVSQIKLWCLVTFESIGKSGSLRWILQKQAVKSECNNTAKADPADFCLRNVAGSTQMKAISAWVFFSLSSCKCSADWFLSGICFLWWIGWLRLMALEELVLMTHLWGSITIVSLADTGQVFHHFITALWVWIWTVFMTRVTGSQQLTRASVALSVQTC